MKQITIIETNNGYYLSDGQGNALICPFVSDLDRYCLELLNAKPKDKLEPVYRCPQCSNWFNEDEVELGDAERMEIRGVVKRIRGTYDARLRSATSLPMTQEDAHWLLKTMETLTRSAP